VKFWLSTPACADSTLSSHPLFRLALAAFLKPTLLLTSHLSTPAFSPTIAFCFLTSISPDTYRTRQRLNKHNSEITTRHDSSGAATGDGVGPTGYSDPHPLPCTYELLLHGAQVSGVHLSPWLGYRYVGSAIVRTKRGHTCRHQDLYCGSFGVLLVGLGA
jgi:hypothetical protein